MREDFGQNDLLSPALSSIGGEREKFPTLMVLRQSQTDVPYLPVRVSHISFSNPPLGGIQGTIENFRVKSNAIDGPATCRSLDVPPLRLR